MTIMRGAAATPPERFWSERREEKTLLKCWNEGAREGFLARIAYDIVLNLLFLERFIRARLKKMYERRPVLG